MNTAESPGPIEAAVTAWAAERRLSRASLEKWLALGERDRRALLELAERLRFRAGQCAVALELLEEIALRERQTIDSILARDDLRRISRGPGSAPGRARALLDRLRALRYPRLASHLARLHSMVAQARLPATVALLLPKDLSSDEVRIQLSVRTAEELSAALGALAENTALLARIIRLLGGEDDL